MKKIKLNIQLFGASESISVVSCTPNIAGNYSTIKIRGTLTSTGEVHNYGGAYMKPTISNQPVVGSQTSSQTLSKKKYSLDYNSTVTGEWTFKVYHKDNGSCNKLTIAMEYYIIDQYSGTKSTTYTPATIPRASDVSATDGTLNTELTINITRKNNTFVHTLRYVCGEQNGWIKDINNKVTTSAPWTPPLALASENKSGQSIQCTIYCQTYDSSGNTIGTETSTTITLTIPTLNPQNVSIGSIADANSYKNTYGVFIQNKSIITATLNGTAQYSDISSYLWEIRQTNASGTLLANGNTNAISYSPNTSGTLYVYGKVTDKRGAYTTTSTTISVTAYSPPTCQLAVSRVNSTSASYTMSGTGTAISTAGYTANTLEFKLVRGSTTVRTTSSGSSYTGTDTISDQSYTYTLTAKDTISGTTDTKTVNISTTFTLINFNSTGYGMAIGKASEATGNNKLLEIAMPTTMNELLTMNTPTNGYSMVDIKAGSNHNEASIQYTNNDGSKGYVAGYGTGSFDGMGLWSHETGQNVLTVNKNGVVNSPGGYYSIDRGNLNNNIAKGSLVVKRAHTSTDTNCPINGIVLEYGDDNDWIGQLGIGDSGNAGIWCNGWDNGVRNIWRRLTEDNWILCSVVVETGVNITISEDAVFYNPSSHELQIQRMFITPQQDIGWYQDLFHFEYTFGGITYTVTPRWGYAFLTAACEQTDKGGLPFSIGGDGVVRNRTNLVNNVPYSFDGRIICA